MRNNRFNNHLINIIIAICAFSLGTLTTLIVVSEKSMSKPSPENLSVETLPKKPHHFLLILIITAPGHAAERSAMRETWLKNKILWKSDIPYDANAVYIPQYDTQTGFLHPETPDVQSYSLDVYKKWMKKYKTINPEMDGVFMKNLSVVHFFAVGTAALDRAERRQLREEHEKYKDLLILENIADSYSNLTRKLLQSLNQLNQEFTFDYLLKCDDDTFVDLPILLQDLQTYDKHIKIAYGKAENPHPTPRLYWGYFNGKAHIRTSGQWQEKKYDLCDKYLPYALGGGYILSGSIVQELAGSHEKLKTFQSEDISMGTWLAPFRDIHRRHDVRFDTAFMPRKCQSHHIVLHKRSIEDMRHFQSGFTCSQIQNDAIRRPKEYFYHWLKPPTQCCDIAIN
ncbi:Hexosyltransferase [Sergentomyia squamirostris]